MTISPVRTAEIRDLERREKIAGVKSLRDLVGPRPIGTTSVERAGGILARAREVERVRKDVLFPTSGAILASCWRDESLRDVLEAAYDRIGWDKMKGLVDRFHDWPGGLAELVEENYRRMKRTIPSARPWDPDDYFLRSTK